MRHIQWVPEAALYLSVRSLSSEPAAASGYQSHHDEERAGSCSFKVMNLNHVLGLQLPNKRKGYCLIDSSHAEALCV